MEPFYIHVDSRDRAFGSSDSFTWQYTSRNVELGEPYELSLKMLEFPTGCVYQVNSNNNRVRFSSDDIPAFIITIPEGNYSATQFAQALTTLVNAYFTAGSISQTITFTYDALQNKFFARIANASPTIRITGRVGFSASERGAFELLGLDIDDVSIPTTDTYMPFQCDMSPMDYVYLRCTQAYTDSFAPATETTSVVYRVQLSAPKNAKAFTLEDDVLSARVLVPRLSSSWRWSIVDSRGRPVSLHGLEWSAALRMQRVPRV